MWQVKNKGKSLNRVNPKKASYFVRVLNFKNTQPIPQEKNAHSLPDAPQSQ